MGEVMGQEPQSDIPMSDELLMHENQAELFRKANVALNRADKLDRASVEAGNDLEELEDAIRIAMALTMPGTVPNGKLDAATETINRICDKYEDEKQAE